MLSFSTLALGLVHLHTTPSRSADQVVTRVSMTFGETMRTVAGGDATHAVLLIREPPQETMFLTTSCRGSGILSIFHIEVIPTV